jgi:CheY-like chemotaxis protein
MDTPLRILVAEDELGDILLLQRAFDKALVKAPVFFARDGRQVLDYLKGNPPFENPVAYPLPALLLLDLKLPYLDGFEVLRWVRSEPGLHHMIVVVFSSSDMADDINRAYALGANSYIIKPQDPDELIQIIKQLQVCWLSINTFPEQRDPELLQFS